MSRPTFSDAPEAIVHDDPEAVPTKVAIVGNTTFGNPAGRLGEMKASSFWLLFGLICILVIAVTVGGAVGGSIAASKNHYTETVTQSLTPSGTSTRSSLATLSPSSTPSLPSQPTVTPTSDCVVTTNGTTYSSLFLTGDEGLVSPNAGLIFTKLYGTEPVGFNLALAYVPTFEACIELCASLNFWNQNKNCLSVTYKVTSPMPGNYWVHNVTNSNVNSDYDSAVLVT